MSKRVFKCERCEEEFESEWSEAEALAEFDNAPWNIPGDKRCSVCDDCFNEFKEWFSTLSEEEKFYLGRRG